jgi:hypothetical protein
MNVRALLTGRWVRRGLIAVAALLLCVIVGFFALPRFVIGAADTPAVDALFVTAFDPRLNNNEYAVSLYRQGLTKKIVCMGNAITCDIFPADYARQHLLALGVPEADVLVLRTPDTDCRAQLFPPTVKFAQEQGWHRINWLVDPAGSRQMRNVLQPKFKAAGIEMFVTYPPAAKAELEQSWWRAHWKMQRMARDPLETTLDLFFAECR